jgi:hypothetical protein
VLPPRYLWTSISTDIDNSNLLAIEEKSQKCILSGSGNDGGTSANNPVSSSNDENNDLYCPWPAENPTQAESEFTSQTDDAELYCSWPRGDEANKTSCSVEGSEYKTTNRNCSVCTISSEDESSTSSLCNSPSESNKKLNGGSQCLRKRVLTHRRCHSSEWAVVRWAMRLPTILHLDGRPDNPISGGVMSSSGDLKLNEDWPPKELEKFEEMFSSFCKSFGYEELQEATSKFSAGLFSLFVSYFAYLKPNYPTYTPQISFPC